MTARAPFAFLYADRGGQIFLSVVLLLAVFVPLLNLALPVESAWHVPTWVMSLLGKYLCFALLALSVDLIWGFCGILSLGHGAFFALGGYAMGMYLMRQIGDRGVYGNPELPDFMVFLNWKELPWYWHGFDNFGFAMIMVLLVPGVLGFVFGWLTFRSRVTGVYLSIISQAMTYALLLAFFRNDMGFGGNNGLTDFKDLLGFDLQRRETPTHWPLCRLGAWRLAGGSILICRAVVSSKLGRLYSSAVRDAESRVRFLGYSGLTNATSSSSSPCPAMLAGVAGALYVPQVGIINPGEFAPAVSIEMVDLGRESAGGARCSGASAWGRHSSTAPRTYFTGAASRNLAVLPGRAVHVAVTLVYAQGPGRQFIARIR